MAVPPMPRSMARLLGRSVNVATTTLARAVERQGSVPVRKDASRLRGNGSTARAFGTWTTSPDELTWASLTGLTVTETGALRVEVAGFYAVTIRCRMQSASPSEPVAMALFSGGGTYDRFDAVTDVGGEWDDGLTAYMELESSGVGFGPQFVGGTDSAEFDGSEFDVSATLLAAT